MPYSLLRARPDAAAQNSDIRAMHNDALLDCVNNLVSYSQYYVNTASMYNLSGDNTRSLRKIVFREFARIAMSRL